MGPLLQSMSPLHQSRTAAQSYAAMVATDGATSHYRLGEASGTSGALSVIDLIGGYHGTPSGVTFGVTGAIAGDANTSVTLAGAGYISTACPFTPGSAFSLEAWAKPTAASGSRNILSSGGGGTGAYAVQLRQGGADWEFYQFNGSADKLAGQSGGVTAGAWHHVVASWDGANTRLHINGILAATTAVTSNPRAGTSSWIGCDGNDYGGGQGQYWLGGLDEIAIYPTALSTAKCLSHSNKGFGI